MHEPMYDDTILQWMEQGNRKDLVNRLWQYALALEEYVIRLCKQVNTLSMGLGLKEPYPDPASDFTIHLMITRYIPNSQYSYWIKILIGKYLINVKADHRKLKTTVCR